MFVVEYNDVGFVWLVNWFVFQCKCLDSFFIWWQQGDFSKMGIGFEVCGSFNNFNGLFNFVCSQCIKWVRVFFYLKGLIQFGLENIVNKGVRNLGFIVFYYYWYLQCQRLIINNCCLCIRFYFYVCVIFNQGKELGVVVLLYIGIKFFKCFIYWYYMCFIIVGKYWCLLGEI